MSRRGPAVEPWKVPAKKVKTKEGPKRGKMDLKRFGRLPIVKRAMQVSAADYDPMADPFAWMSEQDKRKYEMFVHEYVKDFNARAAVMRMGLNMTTAHKTGSRWLNEPYTQYYMAVFLEKCEEKAIVTKNEVLVGLKRELNYHGVDGNSASRVAAAKVLAKILGMEVTRVEGDIKHSGGIMLVPMSAGVDDWEKKAKGSQKTLKEAIEA